jgi:hypothetical protein
MIKQLYCILFILIILFIFKIIYYKYTKYDKLYILSDKYSPPLKKYKIKPNDKFLIFNYDGAGFNNIRISFEVIIIMAKLLNRVLVIPPKKDFSHLNVNSCIFDFYSRKKLSNHINICDYYDISGNIKEVNDLFLFAKKTKNYYFFVNNNIKNKCIYYKNNKLLVYKVNSYIDLKNINKKYLCLFSSFDKKEVKEVLNYKGKIENIRFLNNYDFFFRMDLKDRKDFLYKFIFNSIKINSNIVDTVIKIYNYYNLTDYNAVHLRANDFQHFLNFNFKKKLKEITDIIKKNFNNSKKLFIITDHHTIEDITNHFSNYKIITTKDIYKKFTIEHKYHGLVESLLCVLANEFIGSEMSTFTFYIQILRGYMSKYYDHINDNLMYTTTINPKINYNEFINYQNINPNESKKCIVWDRISNNVWNFI